MVLSPTLMTTHTPRAHGGADRSGQRRRWALRAGAVVAVMMVVVAAASDLGVRRDLDRTSNVLDTTNAALGTTSKELAETKAELADTEAMLASTTTDRDARRAERYAQACELSGVKGSLSDAQSRTNLLAGQIETLKSCLNGVSNALGYAADDYFSAAVAALDAVSVRARSPATCSEQPPAPAPRAGGAGSGGGLPYAPLLAEVGGVVDDEVSRPSGRPPPR